MEPGIKGFSLNNNNDLEKIATLNSENDSDN